VAKRGTKWILIALFLGISGWSVGQDFPSRMWHKGKLVISDQDTVAGELMYDLERNVVQVNVGEQIFTFGAKKIVFFEIFDVTVDAYRQFYSIPFEVSRGYKTDVLFEVVIEGKMSLLCREEIVKRSPRYDRYTWSAQNYFTRNILVYDYYFLTPYGILVKYSMKKKDLLIIMEDHATRVKQYMKAYRLKTDQKADLARITAFYNSLIES